MADTSHYLGFSTGHAWRRALRAAGGVRAVELADGQRIEVTEGRAAAVEAALSTDDEVTPAEASRILAVSRPMVLRWIANGELPDRLVGTHHRIPRAAVLELVERRAAAGRAVVALREAAEAGDPDATAVVEAARQRAASHIAARDAKRTLAGPS
ncbi:MAG: helix-turn-helix domain-containing protein [Actinomycetota bacterium]|nr:helix-turn-helix domain-containing protein [Actinomycetota bacterium]